MIAKLARFCFRRRRIVLGAWVLLLLVSGALQANPGADYKTEFGLPSSESRKGFKVLEENFGQTGGGLNAQFVFEANQGIDDPAVKASMEKFFAVASKLKGLNVTSPYTPEGALQVARQGELAGKLAFVDQGHAES
jgi:putative drug exporter of the RND superfamily